MKELAIIIPVYNEKLSIEKVINDWSTVLPGDRLDVIVVNDGSKDGTLNILEKIKKKITNLRIINKINEGHGKAICVGYQYALERKYKYIFQTDSDEQFLSSNFLTFWEKRNSKKLDIILGDRVERNDPLLRVVLSKLILRNLLLIFFKKNLNDPNVPYRLISRKFLLRFMLLDPSKYIAPNIIMSLYAKNLLYLRVVHLKRATGEVKWSLRKIIKFGVKLLIDLKNFYKNKNCRYEKNKN